MSDAKKGISASQLGRHIGMTYKTAWYVAHRIREAMREARDIQLGERFDEILERQRTECLNKFRNF